MTHNYIVKIFLSLKATSLLMPEIYQITLVLTRTRTRGKSSLWVCPKNLLRTLQSRLENIAQEVLFSNNSRNNN